MFILDEKYDGHFAILDCQYYMKNHDEHCA